MLLIWMSLRDIIQVQNNESSLTKAHFPISFRKYLQTTLESSVPDRRKLSGHILSQAEEQNFKFTSTESLSAETIEKASSRSTVIKN